MSHTTKQRGTKLTLIHGEGDQRRNRAMSVDLVEVLRSRVPSGQLPLPCVAPVRDSVITTSFAKFVSAGLLAVLKQLEVKCVVDIRVAPTFRPAGLKLHEFYELAHDLGVEYKHFSALANHNHSSHKELQRRRFLDHLDVQGEALEDLRALVEDGPVLLLSADASGEDQRSVLDKLVEVRGGFESSEL